MAWAAETAAAAGILVSLDVNHRSRLWSREEARDVLTPLAAHARLVIASDDELDLVAAGCRVARGRRPPGAGRAAGRHQAWCAGATVHTADGRLDLPALAVTAIDPIGAGDAFSAGFLSGVLDGLDPAGCLERAVTTGAFAVSDPR